MKHTIEGRNDIEKAVYLLREIDAWLSFVPQPTKEQLLEMRKSIQDFTSHFPNCWHCGDTGHSDPMGEVPCCCTK
jgi:hypothetical protein